MQIIHVVGSLARHKLAAIDHDLELVVFSRQKLEAVHGEIESNRLANTDTRQRRGMELVNQLTCLSDEAGFIGSHVMGQAARLVV